MFPHYSNRISIAILVQRPDGHSIYALSFSTLCLIATIAHLFNATQVTALSVVSSAIINIILIQIIISSFAWAVGFRGGAT